MEPRNYRLGLRLCTSLDWHHLPSICHTHFTYPTVVKPSWCLPVMCNPQQTHAQWISSGLDLILLLFRFYLPVNKRLDVDDVQDWEFVGFCNSRRKRTPFSVAVFTELRKSEHWRESSGNTVHVSRRLQYMWFTGQCLSDFLARPAGERAFGFLAFCVKCFGNRHLAVQEHGVWTYAGVCLSFGWILLPCIIFFLHTTCLKKLLEQFSVCKPPV